MKAARLTARTLLIASLLLGVSTSSFFPQVRGDEMRLGQAKQGRKVCCCGTKDGRCCGMACCQRTPNPTDSKAPSLPDRSDDRGQPIGIVYTGDAGFDGITAAGFRSGCLAGGAPAIGSVSLIELSIRLNV